MVRRLCAVAVLTDVAAHDTSLPQEELYASVSLLQYGHSMLSSSDGNMGSRSQLDDKSLLHEEPDDNLRQAKDAWEKMRSEGHRSLDHSIAFSEVASGRAQASLCGYLAQALLERRPATASVWSTTVSAWPPHCDLPASVTLAQGNQHGASVTLPAAVTVAQGDQPAENAVELHTLTTSRRAEEAWEQLPPGGFLVVNGLTSQPKEARQLIWQSVYELNSRIQGYMDLPHPADFDEKFGFPQLDFFTVFGDHAFLQKSHSPTQGGPWQEDPVDLQHADGAFARLAKKSGTDKIDAMHNYQLFYHRTLDPRIARDASTAGEKQGMFLEIGLGCTMDYGAGASASIWPNMFPDLSVNFVELDSECTKKWLPKMKELGVAQVHVGSQADPAVLAKIAEDARTFKRGLRLVVDDGSHEPKHIETSFRGLFQHMTSGGIYIVEDMMYSGWATSYGQSLLHDMHDKAQPTEGSPLSLAAVLATSAAGVPEPYKFPARTWSQNLLADYGPTVTSVQCTPGVCGFVRA